MNRDLRTSVSAGCKSPVVRYFVNELFATDDYDKISAMRAKLKRFITSKRMLDVSVADRFGDVLLTPGRLGVFDIYSLTLIFGVCGSSSLKYKNESRNMCIVAVPSDYGVVPLWVLAIEGGEGTKGNAFVHSTSESLSMVRDDGVVRSISAKISIAERTVPMKNEMISFEAYIDLEEWKEFSNTYVAFDSITTHNMLKVVNANAYLFASLFDEEVKK